LDNYSMKAKRKRVDEELMVIKLFASNYARDLMSEDEKSWILLDLYLNDKLKYGCINTMKVLHKDMLKEKYLPSLIIPQ
jgi:hypothetical protein